MESRVSRRVSLEQCVMLCDFLTAHPEVAKAYNRSLNDKSYAQRKWTELSEILNSDGTGAHKDWRGWSKYWVDYKAKLKQKAAAARAAQKQTGGGPSSVRKLSDIERKFLQILGKDLGQRVSGTCKEPFPEPLTSSDPSLIWELDNEPVKNMNVSVQIENISSAYSQPEHIEHLLIKPKVEDCTDEAASPTVEDLHVKSIVEDCSNEVASPAVPQPPLQRVRPARRRKRASFITHKAARQALVDSSKLKTEATIKLADCVQAISQNLNDIKNVMLDMKRVLTAILPRDNLQANIG